MSCVRISGMAARTPVPETAMKFVHGVGLGIIAIHKVAVHHSRHILLTPVSHMLNSVWTGILLDKALFFKIQPLQSFDGLLLTLAPRHPLRGSTAKVSSLRQCFLQYRLHALAMVTHLAKGLKSACCSNSWVKALQSACNNATSDLQ